MQEKIELDYRFGGLEDLKSRNLENLEEIKAIEIAQIMPTTKSGIILPKFVGVYQKKEITAETYEEESNIEEVEKLERIKQEFINNHFKMSIEIRGGKETMYPSLFHVCYNQDFYTKTLTREFLGEGSERIGISSYFDYPNFEEKNFKIFKEFNIAMTKAKNKDDLKKRIEKEQQKVQEQFEKFGLTREEIGVKYMLDSLVQYDDSRLEALFGIIKCIPKSITDENQNI